jgi:DNA-binding transcriptional MerR regulator
VAVTRARGTQPPEGLRPLRIGELAELTGTTPRTVRYYEEIGLLTDAGERAQGKHRVYNAADVERLREIVRLKELLGLSLDQLRLLVEAQDARAALRREYHATESPTERERILEQSLGHIATQLALVRERQGELATLEAELVAKRKDVRRLLREASASASTGALG